MPRRKQEASTEAPAAENIVTGGRPKRACTQRHVPQFQAQPDVSQPTRLSFSDLLTTRAWPAGYFGFGTTFSAADYRNPRVTLDGWKERTFKDLIRHCARKNHSVQGNTSLGYGSAFVSCGSHRSKGRIHRLGSSGMIGTDNCRTMHRFSIADGILYLRKLYSRDATAHETVKLKHFSGNLLFVNRNNDDKASFDDEFAEADWKSPLNCSDLLCTTEATAMKESVIRIASLETGKALRIIWLSNTTNFKAFDSLYGFTRFACGSSQDCVNFESSGCVILFWDLHPFRYKGGVSISAAIFGKDITAADVNDDILMIRHGSQKIRLYSFMSFTKQKLPKPVELGEPWDLTVYPHSTWFKVPDRPPLASATYGARGSGMPVTFFFKERPPILYEVRTVDDYFTTTIKQHLVLVADKKSQELVLINVSTGDKKTGRVRGSSLKTGNNGGGHTFEARNVVVALSNPERIVIWDGQQLCFYGVQDADCAAKFELKQDFTAISPEIKVSQYTEQYVACGFLSYSVSLNAILVIFGLNDTRLLYIIDAVDGVVLSVTTLPKFNYSTTLEEVEVDECGLTYYREFDNQTSSMEFYALQDLPSLLPETAEEH